MGFRRTQTGTAAAIQAWNEEPPAALVRKRISTGIPGALQLRRNFGIAHRDRNPTPRVDGSKTAHNLDIALLNDTAPAVNQAALPGLLASAIRHYRKITQPGHIMHPACPRANSAVPSTAEMQAVSPGPQDAASVTAAKEDIDKALPFAKNL